MRTILGPALAVLALVAPACGGTLTDPGPAPTPTPSAVDWNTCADHTTQIADVLARDMKLDGDTLYVTQYSPNDGIYAFPTAGGAPRRISEQVVDTLLGRAGDRLYYVHEDEVLSVPVAGGEPPRHFAGWQTGAMTPHLGSAVLDGDGIYLRATIPTDTSWGRKVQISRAPLDGSEPTVLFESSEASYVVIDDAFLVQGGSLFFEAENVQTDPWRILSLPATGGTPAVLFSQADYPGRMVAVDQLGLYLSGGDRGVDSTTVRVPLGGGAAQPLPFQLAPGAVFGGFHALGDGSFVVVESGQMHPVLVHATDPGDGGPLLQQTMGCVPVDGTIAVGAIVAAPDALYVQTFDNAAHPHGAIYRMAR